MMENEEEIKHNPVFHVLEFSNKVPQEAKLKQLLRDITSKESKFCSDASKEFRKIISSDSGPDFLRYYLQTSSKCIELLQAWELHKGKPGFFRFLKLVSSMLVNYIGKNEERSKNDCAGSLDSLARVIIEEKLNDLYKELNSKEAKRQNTVLLLLASVVRRGQALAWRVAKNFDFKLTAFVKLAAWKSKGKEGDRRNLTRKAFVGFAMSFLEVGNPRLLRGILQEKNMYSGVLRGLENDDEETITYVLSTLRDRVLVPESMVPPPLRSVLFGSATLEQFINISGWGNGEGVEEVAHSVLITICTDPSNGLMPDMERLPNPLKGNPKRLLDLMKKLNAAEIQNHKDLLLAVVKGKPAFGSVYLDEFPYKLEDISSPSWVAAVSLAADVVSSVGDGLVFGFVNSQLPEPPSFDSPDVQNILKCIGARPFSRLIVNKGLLHSNPLVRHATLRLVLEELKLFDFLLGALKSITCSNPQMMSKWASLRQDIQSEIRILLPDPQVLLSLLSSLNNYHKNHAYGLKRSADFEDENENNSNPRKKLKANDSIDIIVSGVSSAPSGTLEVNDEGPKEAGSNPLNSSTDFVDVIQETWGLKVAVEDIAVNGGETYFYAKLLDVLKIYHCTLPMAFEGTFDFFRVLSGNPLPLPIFLQQSILSLLVGQVAGSRKIEIFTGTQTQLFKYLLSFVKLFMYSPVRNIKDMAFSLAQAAMLSTGAFDRNPREICIWLVFIPGYSRNSRHSQDQEIRSFQKLSSPIISFLCEAISTIGNNLFKYLDLTRCYLQGSKDVSSNISPFIACVLEKCIRLLTSESGTFSLAEKSLISAYVSTTLKYLMETQVEDAGVLHFLIKRVLSERLDGCGSLAIFSRVGCEWRPLKSLLHFSKSIADQEIYNLTIIRDTSCSDGSLSNTLSEINDILRCEHDKELHGIAVGFSFSMICSTPTEILQNFPSIMSVSNKLSGVPISPLSLIFYMEPHLLDDLFNLYPEECYAGLEKVLADINHEGEKEDPFSYGVDSEESFSVAFSIFLKCAPFHMLFPAILFLDRLYELGHARLQQMLLDKLFQLTPNLSIHSLHHVFSVIHRARFSYRIKPSKELEELSEFSFDLAERMLKQCLGVRSAIGDSTCAFAPFVTCDAEQVAKLIFRHPLIGETFESPFYFGSDSTDDAVLITCDSFLEFARLRVHKMDHHVLNLLRTVSELLLPLCNGYRSLSEADHSIKQIADAFNVLVVKLIRVMKERLSDYVKSGDLEPLIFLLYALHNLEDVIPPCDLLELVDWFFSIIDIDSDDCAVRLSVKRCLLYVGLYIAGLAFDSLSACMGQVRSEGANRYLVNETGEKSCDIALLQRIFFRVFEIRNTLESEAVSLCLLKAIKVVELLKHMEVTRLPFSMAISRDLTIIPVNFLSQCMDKLTRVKAEVLYILCKMSAMHLLLFGQLLSDVMSRYRLFKVNEIVKDRDRHYSNEEFFMLAPIVLLYLESCYVKESQVPEHIESIFSFSKVIFHGFSNWKTFVLKEIFHMKFNRCWPSSTEDFLDFVSGSLLGRSVSLIHRYLNLSGCSVTLNDRLSLFNSVCSGSTFHDDLLNFKVAEVGISSLEDPLDIGNRIVAKIRLSRILLFHEGKQYSSQLEEAGAVEEINTETNSSKVAFLNMLVDSWKFIVKRSHSGTDNSGEGEQTKGLLCKFLENFIVFNIFELTKEMRLLLIRLNSLPLIENLFKYSLRHRFDDPGSLKMVRTVLATLSEGKFSCISFLQLLLSHSQFASALLFARKSANPMHYGLVLTSIASIMRSANFARNLQKSSSQKNDSHSSGLPVMQLELVKLLRVLFQILAQQCKSNVEVFTGIDLKKLVLLLLSSYGATLSEIDIEIYRIINVLESLSESVAESITQLDFLWGFAAENVMKERENEKHLHSGSGSDVEAIVEDKRNRFRENFPVDPNLCQRTVLFFPFNRPVYQKSSHALQNNEYCKTVQECKTTDNDSGIYVPVKTTDKESEIYDPVFILRFSIHCLSMDYVEPLEFASVGLLAVTFVSLSSPDDDVRKLGYEVLGLFKASLEKCPKRMNVKRLQLLLLFLQNGITEPLQRIPSMTAVFVAEASLVLLDSAHDHYAAISKSLVQSPGANTKAIPLFEDFFWSNSVNFKTERLWILRLLYGGLNLDDDGQTCIRNSIFEVLLSFYTSPLCDDESKDLIIQIVKKAMEVPKLARYLIKQCGIISWFSSLVSSASRSQWKEHGSFPLARLSMTLEAANGIFKSENMSKWLAEHALEQLIELSSGLFKLLVDRNGATQVDTRFVGLVLQISTLTLKISQERKVYHHQQLFLGFEGFYQLCEIVDAHCGEKFSPVAALALEVILMSTPTPSILTTEQGKISKFLTWSITVAFHYSSTQYSVNDKENLISKLLRWLSASVILGKISRKIRLNYGCHPERLKLRTLQSLLQYNEKGSENNGAMIAKFIFYLQQLVGIKGESVISVVSALALLILSTPYSSDSLHGIGHPLGELAMKIRSPCEANPGWKWSFKQPWKDDSSPEPSDTDKIEEFKACQNLVVELSKKLTPSSLHSEILSQQDLEKFHALKWTKINSASSN